jgi:hypothetical protein
LKRFTVNCSRVHYAVILAWCRQSEVVPHDLTEAGVYEPINLDALIGWYSTYSGTNTAWFSLYVDEIEYTLLALRWPQYHCKS